MLSLFNISVKVNLDLSYNEIRTLDDSGRGPHAFFPEGRVYIFGSWKYPSDRASVGPSVNRHPALTNV